MDITQKMIGAIDLLEMNFCEVDQIFPAIKEIHQALLSYPNLKSDNECLMKITSWVDNLKGRNFNDSLSEDDIRKLKFDLDSSFASFKTILDQ